MAHRSRTPNLGLANLLEQAGWSRSQLALIVNRIGAEAGLALQYGQPAVSQWIAGHQPRAQVRALVIEAFERKLARPVSYAEAGLTPPPGTTEADTVRDLVDLGRADMDPSRRRVIAAGVFSAALVIPLFPSLARADSPDPIAPGKATTRVGQAQVAAIQTMTDRIADILDELGAGHARPMAAAFLVNAVGPWLKAEAAAPIRRSMLAAASDLVYLTGWMAMYERQHRLGQDYYVSALKLAGEAEEHVTYCRTLRGMSLQASNLGYGRRALELADSAAEAAPAAARDSSRSYADNKPTALPWWGTSVRRSPGCARRRKRWRAPTTAGRALEGTTARRTCSTSPTYRTRRRTSSGRYEPCASRSASRHPMSGRAGCTPTASSRNGNCPSVMSRPHVNRGAGSSTTTRSCRPREETNTSR